MSLKLESALCVCVCLLCVSVCFVYMFFGIAFGSLICPFIQLIFFLSFFFQIPSSSKPSAHTGVMGDNIESHGHVTPEKEMEKMLFRAKLREILHELPEAERTIVALR